MVWQFIEIFKKVKTDQIEDDDFSDRLSHRYSVMLLLIFCVLVGSTQFVGSPISCWVPAHFSGSMTSYTNNICWISNTYFVPTSDTLPNPGDPRQYRINYYQWVPFILALMALLFFAPWALWHLLSKPSNLDARGIMKLVNKIDPSSTEAREKTMRNIARLIDRSIEYNRELSRHSLFGKIRRMVNRCFLPLDKHTGAYISTLYIFIKIIYLANVFGQFFLMNAFMGPRFNLYGFHVIRDIWMGKDFWESPRFPRVTMCDFVIRTLGENNHRNTIQCTLPINLFNEKIFIFLWFWMATVFLISAYSFFVWLFNFTGGSRVSFVKRYLKVNHKLAVSSSFGSDTTMMENFVFDYLRQDGVFLLRIVKKNTNDLVVGELVCALWDLFKRYPKFVEKGDLNDDSLKHHEQEKLTQEH